MMKQVQKSERMQALVAKAYGDPDVNIDGLAIFEAIIANNTPLRRPQGIYAGAVLQQDAMASMVDVINNEGVALQLMHRSGIPAGKVFHAEMKPTPKGGTQVNALFYLPKSNSEYVSKIDAGVINDVSVGFLPNALQCSSCGFDYLGEKCGLGNLMDLTCDQGHKIGKDGVHARVHGVSNFSELSLVDKGAVPGAFILPRPKQSAGVNPNMARLAELGIDERPFYLAASMAEFIEPHTPPEDTSSMDALIELKADLLMAGRDAIVSTATITDLTAKLAASQAEAVVAHAATAAAKVDLTAALAVDGVKAQADLAVAMELVNEFGKATLAALGTPDAKLPELVSDAVAMIRKARADLAMSLPMGGRSRPAADDSNRQGDPAANPNFAAFKRA